MRKDPISPAPRPTYAANLQYLRKQAKALLRAYERGDPHAVLRLRAAIPYLRDLAASDVASAKAAGLAEAQFTIARELGQPSWPKLKLYLEERVRRGENVSSELNQQLQNQEKSPMSESTSQTKGLGLSAIQQVGMSCTDLEVAQKFYCDLLGLRFVGDAPPNMKFFGCDGVNILMTKGDKVSPNLAIYFKVEGVAGLIQEKFELLQVGGAKLLDEKPRCIARNWNGEDIWLAFFSDPFGNMLCLFSGVPVKK